MKISKKNDEALPTLLPAEDYDNLFFTKLRISYYFASTENRFRNDKTFQIGLYFDYFIRTNRDNFWAITATLDKTFERKYDDFIIRFFYTWRSPGSSFYFDHKLTSREMRGYEDNLLFSRHSFQLILEYKLSLYKEKLKLIFFSDNAFFRPIDYSKGGKSGRFKFENSIGEGIEFNIYEFSCRLYYGVPYKEDLLNGRIYLRLRKVF